MNKPAAVMALVFLWMLCGGCGAAPTPGPTLAVPQTAPTEQAIPDERALQSSATALAAGQATFAAQQTEDSAAATASAAAAISATPEPVVVPTQTEPAMLATDPPAAVKTADAMPFYVYQDYNSPLNHFKPAGWMGDIMDITFDENYRLDPERPVVIQIKYARTGPQGWCGVYWWHPANSGFGTLDGGYDLSKAAKLTFLARGENGGEKGDFKIGGIKGSYSDSLQPAFSTGPLTLTKEWQLYTLDLRGKDLSHTLGGFVWVTNNKDNLAPATIYLDEIKLE